MKEKSKQTSCFYKFLWPIFACCVGLMYLVCYTFQCIVRDWFPPTDASQFGEQFGGLNTFFTGCAFVGLVFTIILQRKEMKETREEFESQTKEFAEQTKISQDQAKREDIYRRIELLKKLEEAIKISRNGNTYIGAEATTVLVRVINLLLSAIRGKKEYTELTKNDIRLIIRAKHTLTPWLLTFADLLKDISEYFSDKPKEIDRFYRVVFNISPTSAQALLYLFQGELIDSTLIDYLREQKYIQRKDVSAKIWNKAIHPLFHEVKSSGIDFEILREKWQKILADREAEKQAKEKGSP